MFPTIIIPILRLLITPLGHDFPEKYVSIRSRRRDEVCYSSGSKKLRKEEDKPIVFSMTHEKFTFGCNYFSLLAVKCLYNNDKNFDEFFNHIDGLITSVKSWRWEVGWTLLNNILQFSSKSNKYSDLILKIRKKFESNM
eukprot:UN31350